jgi:hypothetical protein
MLAEQATQLAELEAQRAVLDAAPILAQKRLQPACQWSMQAELAARAAPPLPSAG